MPALAGLLISLAATAPPQTHSVRLDLGPALACDLNSGLPLALSKEGLDAAPEAEAIWTVTARQDATSIELRLLDPAAQLRAARRLTPAPSDCPALARAVVVLLKTWLATGLVTPSTESPQRMPANNNPGVAAPERNAPSPAPPATESPTVAPRPPALPTAPRPSATPFSAERAPQPALQVAVSPASAPEHHPESPLALLPTPSPPPPPQNPRVPLAPPTATADSVQPDAPNAVEQAPSSPPALAGPRSFSTMLGGGGAIGPNDDPVATGRLTLEWGFLEPWAVAVEAGLQSERTKRTNDGSVDLSLQFAGVYARRSFFASGLDGLHLSVGAQLIRLVASVNGFTTRNNLDLLTGAAVANLEWRQTLTAGLFLLGRLSVQARVPQTFSVSGYGPPVLSLPGWGFGLEGGIGWNFL
jgi:hypothetical protein